MPVPVGVTDPWSLSLMNDDGSEGSWACLLSWGLPVMVLGKAMGSVLHGHPANREKLDRNP